MKGYGTNYKKRNGRPIVIISSEFFVPYSMWSIFEAGGAGVSIGRTFYTTFTLAC